MFIPGAWHGAWSWRPVAERVRASGHQAITLTLPGLNDGDNPSGYRLKDAVDFVVTEVHRLEVANAILVAHSWGGYPATGAAALLADRVSKIVYFNATVPVLGRSQADDLPAENHQLTLTLIDESPTGAIAPTLEFVERQFMQGVAPELQRLVADLLTPQPGGYFLDALDIDPTILGIPTAYIASDSDQSLPWPAAEFAARLGVEPVAVPGTHDSMLTHPDEVAKAILAL
ncbi:alpha/beta fold hydrolase [Mycobacterium marseillense]|uniref:alpha/beta fold hydrolase n=1 Tax=Mycobacterium marseillense TaxID=701042 RepID=UPI0011A1D970|nr:alpha/beta hydrolase [Mycobacterium marseillense]